jgi:ASCH domain
LVRDGLKKTEVRSWTTAHRGDLLICAAKAVDNSTGIEYDTEPRGSTICLVTLTDCRPLRESDARHAMFNRREWILHEGLYGWLLSDPRPLKPRHVTGRLGLFDVPSRLIVPA